MSVAVLTEAALAFLAGPLIGAWTPDAADVDAECFLAPEHRALWEAEHALYSRGQQIGRASLIAETVQQGAKVSLPTMQALTAKIPDQGAADYARILRDGVRRFKLADTLQRYAQQLRSGIGDTNEVVAEAEAAVYEQARPTGKLQVVEIKTAALEELKRIDARSANPGRVWGVPSGIAALDQLTGGFREGELIVIGARPGIGKSALAENIIAHVALRWQPEGVIRSVLVFSLEMSALELAGRWLASEARVDADGIRNGIPQHDHDAHRRLVTACGDAQEAHAGIVESLDVTPATLRSTARAYCARMERQGTPLALVVVDYMQLIRGAAGAQNREQEIAKTSRSLKAIAKELKVAVIALSQLNREGDKRANKRPMLSDLRESGSLEQDANAVIFIHRPDEQKPEEAELIIAKQRNGPSPCTVRARWRPEFLLFQNGGLQ
jgi:replicative DNA helicase